MNAAVPLYPVEPPLSAADVDKLVADLPAEDRAALRWTVPALRAALRRLLTEPLTPVLVIRVTQEVQRAQHSLGPALQRLGEAKILRPAMDEIWRERIALLHRYLQDPASADAAEWAFRAVLALYELAQTVAAKMARDTPTPRAPAPEVDADALLHSDLGALLRAQVLVMGLFQAAEDQAPQARAEEMAELAFLEACRGVDTYARLGIQLDPFRREGTKERGERIERYAGYVRSSLSEDDMQALAEARMHALP